MRETNFSLAFIQEVMIEAQGYSWLVRFLVRVGYQNAAACNGVGRPPRSDLLTQRVKHLDTNRNPEPHAALFKDMQNSIIGFLPFT